MDRDAQAEVLCGQLLEAQADTSCVLWVAPDRSAVDTADRLPVAGGPGRLRLLGYDSQVNMAWLACLDQELSNALPLRRPSPWLVLVSLPSSAWEATADPRFHAWCRAWFAWVRRMKVCLVFVTQGAGGLRLRGRLHSFNDLLDGLLHQRLERGDLRHRVVFWRNGWSVTGAGDLPMVEASGRWQWRTGAALVPSGDDDATWVLIQRECLEGLAPPEQGRWEVLDGPEAVVSRARAARDALVVLGIARYADVETMARWVHDLRLTRGSRVMLVVRELAPCLRHGDARLLSLCGASLVVKRKLSVARFLEQVWSIRGQRWQGSVNPDVEAILEAHRVNVGKGALMPGVFVERLQQWLASRGAGDYDHLMVSLHPGQGLDADQVLAVCRFQREGDIGTAAGGRLYLFLSDCPSEEMDSVLKRFFGASFESLFVGYTLFDSPETIAPELVRLVQEPATSPPMEISDAAPPDTSSVVPRPVPVRLRVADAKARSDHDA